MGNYREGILLCTKALKRQPDFHAAKVPYRVLFSTDHVRDYTISNCLGSLV